MEEMNISFTSRYQLCTASWLGVWACAHFPVCRTPVWLEPEQALYLSSRLESLMSDGLVHAASHLESHLPL